MSHRPSRIQPLARLSLLLITLMLAGWIGALIAPVQPAGAMALSTPVPISPTGVDAASSAIVAGPDGLVHIAWEQDDGIWYRSGRDDAWSAPVQLAVDGEQPALALSPDGQIVYLAWDQSFNDNYDVFVRRYDARGWALPQNISANQGGSSAPGLAVASSGRVHLLWADTSPGVSTLYHAVSTDGVTWPVALPVPNAVGEVPVAALANDGDLVIAWQHRADSAQRLRIWTARYHDGLWSAPVTLTDGGQHALAPAIAANAGRVALAWQEGADVKLAFWRDSAWQAASTQPGARPAIAIDDSGLSFWAWETDAGLVGQFGRANWALPQLWDGTDAHSSDLALVARGHNIHLTWTSGQNDGDHIFYDTQALGTIYLPIISQTS